MAHTKPALDLHYAHLRSMDSGMDVQEICTLPHLFLPIPKLVPLDPSASHKLIRTIYLTFRVQGSSKNVAVAQRRNINHLTARRVSTRPSLLPYPALPFLALPRPIYLPCPASPQSNSPVFRQSNNPRGSRVIRSSHTPHLLDCPFLHSLVHHKYLALSRVNGIRANTTVLALTIIHSFGVLHFHLFPCRVFCRLDFLSRSNWFLLNKSTYRRCTRQLNPSSRPSLPRSRERYVEKPFFLVVDADPFPTFAGLESCGVLRQRHYRTSPRSQLRTLA